MEEELKTVIENKTKCDLEIKLFTRNGLVPVGVVKFGSRHTLKHCLSWTFQDYVVETKHAAQEKRLKVTIDSDICCDYERIIVKESVEGKLVVDKEARKPWSLWRWACNAAVAAVRCHA